MEPDRWLGVELRHLAALQAIAEEGSFGRAARRLGYTQSAVSQQIATLERIVGERLVERRAGRVRSRSPRPAELLLRHAAGDRRAARGGAGRPRGALAAGAAGTLRVGTYQSIGKRVLPTLMRRFRSAWPSVELRITEMNTDQELVRLVERGDLDLTFADFRLWDGPFEWLHLLDDPYVLLVQAGSPLAARRTPPSLEEICELPLIGFRRAAACGAARVALPLGGARPGLRLPLRRQRHRAGDGRRRRRGRARPAPDGRLQRPRDGAASSSTGSCRRAASARLAPRPLPLAGRARRSPRSRARSAPGSRSSRPHAFATA